MLDDRLNEIFKKLETMSPKQFEREMQKARKSPWYSMFCEIFKDTPDGNATSCGRG